MHHIINVVALIVTLIVTLIVALIVTCFYLTDKKKYCYTVYFRERVEKFLNTST